MDSRSHAIHAGILAVVIVLLSSPPIHPVLLGGFVVALGVGIDFDHFIIARINTGSWKNLGRVVRDPRLVFFDQSAIFDRLDVWGQDRLFSHMLLTGLGVGLFWLVGLPYWSGVTAATLYTHIVADLYDDVRSRERTTLERARALEAERADAA